MQPTQSFQLTQVVRSDSPFRAPSPVKAPSPDSKTSIMRKIPSHPKDHVHHAKKHIHFTEDNGVGIKKKKYETVPSSTFRFSNFEYTSLNRILYFCHTGFEAVNIKDKKVIYSESMNLEDLKVSDSRNRFVTITTDGILSFWRLNTGELVGNYKANKGSFRNCKTFRFGTAVLDENNHILLFDYAGKLKKQISLTKPQLINTHALTMPDKHGQKNRIFAHSPNGKLTVYNEVHIKSFSISDEHSRLVAYMSNGSIAVVDLSPLEFSEPTESKGSQFIDDILLIEPGKLAVIDENIQHNYLFTGDKEGNIVAWNILNGEKISLPFPGPAEGSCGVRLINSTIKDKLIVVYENNTCFIWDLKTAKPLQINENHRMGAAIQHLHIVDNMDDKYLITAHNGNEDGAVICLWNLDTRKGVKILERAHKTDIKALKSLDKYLVTSDVTGKVFKWDLEPFQESPSPELTSKVNAIAENLQSLSISPLAGPTLILIKA